ncbi:putative olfactory receptor 2B3 [Trichosurus vulpecula]|uniref:putative olfactory receptor 2B3 n=1 Tax=Trichosurus vulpecula TaxID=9337 RepID=UPI00186AD519|nr:putative olfactory receptor 2B3 [Trichosurus vulpecula]
MSGSNESLPEVFILLGFSNHAWLELPLFLILLFIYPLALLGNISIILVCILDYHLHSPMYFFLSNLSLVDICYTTSIVPQILFNLGSSKKTISYMGCAIQLYFFHFMAASECLLLAVMSFDRYVAICKPLRYTLIMNHQICILLVSIVFSSSLIYAVSETALTLQLPMCGHNELDHVVCEIPVLIKAACGDKSSNELGLSVVCVFFLAIPLALVITSYAYIGQAVMKIQSAAGRKKAFGTCSSHLIVVLLFYGPAISIYIQPPSSITRDQPKCMALFYGVVTPTLNPFIYTLRNKDVKGALGNLLRRIFRSKGGFTFNVK